MEACKAVAEVVHRQLDAIPALKEMLAELPPADHVDDGGLGGNDGGGCRVAVETIGVMADEVARSGGLHHLLGAVVVAHRVLETACLDVTKQAGGIPLRLNGLARRKRCRLPMAQAEVAQMGQGLGVVFFLFHTLLFLHFLIAKIVVLGIIPLLASNYLQYISVLNHFNQKYHT